jgi:hypothetical protein
VNDLPLPPAEVGGRFIVSVSPFASFAAAGGGTGAPKGIWLSFRSAEGIFSCSLSRYLH